MEINFQTQIPKILNSSRPKPCINKKQSEMTDCFISTGNIQKSVSFTGNFLSALFSSEKYSKPVIKDMEIPSEYTAQVASGLNRVMGCNLPAKNLNCLMTPKEFQKILPSLKTENYIYSRKNIDSGIYCADLDYQTSFSDGKENVFDILDDVAEFADDYAEKTGKPFIFALTDRDSLEGLQHAIRIIASNPDKYKNVKFLPGIKMSFAHEAPKSNLGYESSDMLVYGINPFSENVINFVDSTIRKRKAMTVDFIKKVNKLYPEFAYSVIEFATQNKIKYKKDFAVSNLYWRAREYAETKGDTAIKSISMVPEDILKEAEEILNELDKVYLGSAEKEFSALGSTIIKDEDVNPSIKQVFDEYSTHYDPERDKVVSSDDNLYQDMIECLSKEPQQPVLALCDPYYFSHYFEGDNQLDQMLQFFNRMIQDSNNMLVAFESVSPAYRKDSNLTPDKVKTFNNFLRDNTNLLEVGGSFAKRFI